ncbi:MAG TPA: UDP-diphospho-muramoylpentapeptide beta-N-acetylglucosaminyltransferase [Lachnospiraceae bacterium]|jgi:UDP-N-acetylglucosamine:LPS N-acetylglucosamine transferase|nr:UDP-diphospho-muramoylpentapeptide beta-N-acetylglucosaminyltransferase [Lachnospiraceae bacterium]HBY72898.1 UDP-diphospho-muramoylpentapeptide beta-N-acetylglucosaminyltransferase [Lachnospiraceae bacterium]HCA70894.1 UDP-diphospho-muramoylpentapeptide beta-N-acetylglucosaminyltransferase [Lachnospiraceae bacterium]HCM14238.1 UDP-diphospho-muramoylpentapeptide beta-N-acetylglucosaminyltransferase [Lachnospiraceae bacterium]
MKISILTGKFGMGHYTAAMAIKQQIDASNLDADVEVVDWFSYVAPKTAEKYYKFFSLLVCKGNRLYNTRYRFLENRKIEQKPELSHYFGWHFKKFMEEKSPDLIISTLPFCSQIVSIYKEKTGSDLPLITCVTDITGHSEWISKNTDLYLVGSTSVKDKFIGKGVLPEKIRETGIPVRMEFMKKALSKEESNCPAARRILVMGGGLGLIREDSEFYNGLNSLPDAEVTIISGNNHKLYHQLFGQYKHIRVLGYVPNVYDYMQKADVIITKPGGITTFEAIYSEVPILALNPFLQQEIYNAQYIKEMNIGTVVSGNSQKCLDHIVKILDYGYLDNYRYSMRMVKNNLYQNSMIPILEAIINDRKHAKDMDSISKYSRIKEDGRIDEKISFNF